MVAPRPEGAGGGGELAGRPGRAGGRSEGAPPAVGAAAGHGGAQREGHGAAAADRWPLRAGARSCDAAPKAVRPCSGLFRVPVMKRLKPCATGGFRRHALLWSRPEG